jgi:predicted nucleic acid-binding protein
MTETIYFDTSVPSAYYDNRELEKMKITRAFWKGLSKYKTYISEIVIAELGKSREPKRSQFKKLIAGIGELSIDSIVEKLADEYIVAKIIPVRFRLDAVHIAIASTHKINYLVTWNCRHMAGAHKRVAIREFNEKKGIFAPEIATPTEFVEEEG